MTVRFRCAECRQRLRAVDRLVGRTVRCPRCRSRLQVPDVSPLEVDVKPDADPTVVQPAATGVEAPPPDRIVISAEDLDSIDPDWQGPAIQETAWWQRQAAPGPAYAVGGEHVNKTCPFCQSKIGETDRVAVCGACGIPHHEECWRENGGCTTFGCEAGPPPPGAPTYAPASVGRAMPWVCSNCGGTYDQASSTCPYCGSLGRRAATAGSSNPEAATALAMTIFGILFPLLLPFAIWQGARALQRAEENPSAGGDRAALAAIVLSTVAGVVWIAVAFGLASG